MNILLINFEYPPLGGGGGVMTAQIAEELAKRHTVHVITTAFANTKHYEFIHGVHIHRVSVLGRTTIPTATFISLITFAPASLALGLSLTRKHAFDIINAHFVIPSGVPALMLAMIRKIPLVVTLVGGDIYDPSKGISPHRHGIFRSTIRTILRHANAITAISQDTKQRAIELHSVSQDITVIPIGLVPYPCNAIPREALGLTDTDFLCVSIGRLVPRKGYETLLDAWRNIPNAHLLIIGDGPLRRSLQSLIDTYQLSNRVRLVGFISEQEKQGMLRTANLYVSAAQHEGFGIVFLEAMDAGLPIVAANDGGQKDFLEHGKNALLVPPHDTKKITSAVLQIMENPDLRTTIQEHNKEDVRGYYIDKTAGLLEDVLLDTVAHYERHH